MTNSSSNEEELLALKAELNDYREALAVIAYGKTVNPQSFAYSFLSNANVHQFHRPSTKS
jgi:hypothetical protein